MPSTATCSSSSQHHPSDLPSLSSTVAGTSASSSMPASPNAGSSSDPKIEDGDADAEKVDVKAQVEEELKAEGEGDVEASARAARLNFLLEKSTIYAKIIGDRMERQQVEKRKAEQRAAVRKENKEKKGDTGPTRGGLRAHEGPEKRDEKPGSKRKRKSEGGREEKKAKVEDTGMDVETKPETNGESSAIKKEEQTGEQDDGAEAEDNGQYTFSQPSLITGAKLRDYQLAGVQWMISLYENGLNGILADEMGLGKTLQTISFLAHLRSKGTWGPFLIACPLSVLNNWIMEFEKFAPSIPVLMYHGTPEHRADLRATRLSPPVAAGVESMKKGKGRGRYSTGSNRAGANTTATFPVVVTTYEMCMKDQKFLSGFMWKFIVVDEGHRLKNLDCKLIRELKSYTSANRMILTGTPLHNNLAELWSLLNFILPDIFDDLDSFQQWFNFDDMNSSPDNSGLLNKSSIVQSLHEILKPFLLRRLKVDVEKELPPKKEYLLYAPLTQTQKDIYQAIVSGQIRQYLVDVKRKQHGGEEPEEEREPTPELDHEPAVDSGEGRKIRKTKKVNYKIEENDSKYIRDLENGLKKDEPNGVEEKSAAQIGKEWALKQATKHVNNMRLQNLVMQLRKISSHPFLFDWPVDEKTNELVVSDDLVNASGKMLLLNRLLGELFKRGHKVLLFSQFTTMLDVIEDWATMFKKWKVCRIDGSTSQEDRRSQMEEFNNDTSKTACKLFLLSTRAGGLGVNLVAADTVIFFDQDWNPQMDLQAQDRAHRIGQTRPVLVFRLVSAHTIETKILQKAGNKRKLEALVISQGKFGRMVDENGRVLLGRGKSGAAKEGKESMAEMARALLDLEGEEINTAEAGDTIISDADLDILLDRSPAAFQRTKGWSAGLGKGGAKTRAEQIKKGERTAFEVFVPGKDEASEGLAKMFDGDGEAEE
ncbi:putative helicase [Kockovaella imperatae]|uniref:Putative helicase n=1 Tax=Kockovaella imperatae TaxID=4999 RepID=A0A1Y1U961_9TREE|nr:putative helicase [Kockovaella imperatae]ORX34552.1 putative helicase [Kockovaella imperatae]